MNIDTEEEGAETVCKQQTIDSVDTLKLGIFLDFFVCLFSAAAAAGTLSGVTLLPFVLVSVNFLCVALKGRRNKLCHFFYPLHYLFSCVCVCVLKSIY